MGEEVEHYVSSATPALPTEWVADYDQKMHLRLEGRIMWKDLIVNLFSLGLFFGLALWVGLTMDNIEDAFNTGFRLLLFTGIGVLVFYILRYMRTKQLPFWQIVVFGCIFMFFSLGCNPQPLNFTTGAIFWYVFLMVLLSLIPWVPWKEEEEARRSSREIGKDDFNEVVDRIDKELTAQRNSERS